MGEFYTGKCLSLVNDFKIAPESGSWLPVWGMVTGKG